MTLWYVIKSDIFYVHANQCIWLIFEGQTIFVYIHVKKISLFSTEHNANRWNRVRKGTTLILTDFCYQLLPYLFTSLPLAILGVSLQYARGEAHARVREAGFTGLGSQVPGTVCCLLIIFRPWRFNWISYNKDFNTCLLWELWYSDCDVLKYPLN